MLIVLIYLLIIYSEHGQCQARLTPCQLIHQVAMVVGHYGFKSQILEYNRPLNDGYQILSGKLT